MTWRKTAWVILFSPIWLGLIVLITLMFISKLPMVFSERRRAIRYLPYAGLAYYGLALPLLLVALGLAWWKVLIGSTLLAFGGDWLLPDPFTYLLNPRKRRAVKLAIEHLEAGEGPQPIYGMVSVIGSEADRSIVSIAIKGDTKPPARRFLAIADETASAKELDFEYVSRNHGVRAWR